MSLRPLRRALLAVACLLLLTLAVSTPEASAGPLSKRGASGQIYVWQSGSC